MSAPNTKSAYPVPVDELVPQVREWALAQGRWPSQNQVMTEFRVGVSKARAVLAALRDAGFDPTTTGTGIGETARPGGAGVARRLRAISDTASADPADSTDATATGDDDTIGGSGHEDASEPPTAALDATHDVQVSQPGAPVPGPSTADAHAPAELASWMTQPAPTEQVAGPDLGAVPPVATRARWQVLSLVLLSLPAFVAIWGGWVGLGRMTGFGDVELLPGIADGWVIDSAITLPIGVETYAAFALRVWLSRSTAAGSTARRYAMWSAFAALLLGMTGQVAYHLMSAAGIAVAPWPITTVVACLPVAVLGSGAALAHLMHSTEENQR